VGPSTQAHQSRRQLPRCLSAAAWRLRLDGLLSFVPESGLGGSHGTGAVKGVCVSDGGDCAGAAVGVEDCRGADYFCGPHLWGEQAGGLGDCGISSRVGPVVHIDIEEGK